MALTISGSNISGWDATYYGGGSTSTGGTSSASVNGSDGSYTYSGTGYATLEGGLILQWGSSTTSSARSGASQYFSISFPTVCIAVVMNEGGAGGWGTGPLASNGGGAGTVYAPTFIGTQYFNFEGAWVTPYFSYYTTGAGQGPIGMHWYAIGY